MDYFRTYWDSSVREFKDDTDSLLEVFRNRSRGFKTIYGTRLKDLKEIEQDSFFI